MDYALVALAGFLAGAFLASALILLFRHKLTKRGVGSVTWFLFVFIALSAISWVYISYALAIYATVHLGQVYTMAELSQPAITGIVAVLFAKVLGNIFEHNDGPLWGKTNKDKHEYEEEEEL